MGSIRSPCSLQKDVYARTWDRLIVVPFRGRFRSQENEIKNYGNYLVRACGGAILSWIIDGAREYIRNDYKLDIPECIISATEQYQQENDWLTDFFNEWVALDKNEDTYGSDIYGASMTFTDGMWFVHSTME